MMELDTLDNGLRVASRTMASVETLACGLYCDTGSRAEPERLSGLAHLFEHMVFKGAGGRTAREISERIENVGGDLNAATDRETTSFHASLLADDLALGVGLIADLVRRPHFEPGDLALERKVVESELAEARDNACDIVFDHLQQAAFPGQPMGRSILGNEASLAAINVADLHDWRETHYAPNRLILVAAGKLEHRRLVDLAQQAFGDMARRDAPAILPARFAGGRECEERRSRQTHLAIGARAPAWNEKDNYAAQLFADVVGVGAACRLFQELRERQGLAYSVSGYAQSWSDTGLFTVYVAAARDDVGRVQAEAERVLADAAGDLGPAELDRARAMLKAGLLMSLESCWGQASYLAARLLREGRLTEPKEIVARIERLSVEEVRAAGTSMLAGPRAIASVGGRLALAA